MAIQVSYPGVYIDEYAPAAPIEGVSTSVTAFIGLAEKGPIGVPTLVTSFDEFTARFGGPVLADVPYYLPLAVAGFYRNGGAYAYITRVATAVAAHADLLARAGAPAPKLARIDAQADGAAGEGGSVKVTDSSLLAKALAAAGAAGTTVPAHQGEATISTVDATRRSLTVDDSSGFQTGDLVVLTRGASKSPGRLTVTAASGSVQLGAAAPAGPGGNEWTKVVSADLAVGDRTVRLDVPPAVSLRATVPAGSVLKLTSGANPVWAVAADVGADVITLAAPLAAAVTLASVAVATAEFELDITAADGTKRSYSALSSSPSHPRWWITAVDDPYARIVLAEPEVLPAGDPRPVATTTPIAGAQNDDPGKAWQKVRDDMEKHLSALAPIDEISLVTAPGMTDAGAQRSIVEHCERLYDRFAILDSLLGVDLNTVVGQRQGLTGTKDKGFAALYYPWILSYDPTRKRVMPQPPSGHLAGIYAITDRTRGVHKAPANVGIAGAIGLERRLSDADQGLINLEGVNALRILPGQGAPVVWGARTTANDTNWQYVNIRRLFLYLEESIQEALGAYVFEPNDLALWQKLKRTLNDFLARTWRDGALFGATAKDAFFVRIDEALNPPATRKLGRLYIEIGVQPSYPAEFIVVRIGIWDGGSEVSES
jgi:phage tail sheath protein FI